MGVSYCAYLMYGVPFTKILWNETIEEEVTRYNETTGKPFKKKIQTNKKYLFGKEISENELDDIEYKLEKDIGLKTFCTDCESDERFIGVKISELEPGKYSEISDSMIKEAKQKVTSILRDKGASQEVLDSLKLYLISYVGY